MTADQLLAVATEIRHKLRVSSHGGVNLRRDLARDLADYLEFAAGLGTPPREGP